MGDINHRVTASAIERLTENNNNNPALDLILDNSVVYVEYGRLVTKADYLLRIKHRIHPPDEIVLEPIIVRVFGSTAIVTGSSGPTKTRVGC